MMLLLTSGIADAADRFDGRRYIVTDGRADNTVPARMIVVLHGFLGSAGNMRKKTSFDVLAMRHGLVILYPNGILRRWNDGYRAKARIDDVSYLSGLVAKVGQDLNLRPSAIYWAGHSNGGGMVMRMACEQPDLVDGVAVVATKASPIFRCANGKPVPAIFFHGTADPIAPHGGRSDGNRFARSMSAAKTLRIWQQRNGCSADTLTAKIDAQDDGTTVKVAQYSGCIENLAHVVIDGHGHDWPGYARATRLQGPATREINAAQFAWWFFTQQ